MIRKCYKVNILWISVYFVTNQALLQLLVLVIWGRRSNQSNYYSNIAFVSSKCLNLTGQLPNPFLFWTSYREQLIVSWDEPNWTWKEKALNFRMNNLTQCVLIKIVCGRITKLSINKYQYSNFWSPCLYLMISNKFGRLQTWYMEGVVLGPKKSYLAMRWQ